MFFTHSESKFTQNQKKIIQNLDIVSLSVHPMDAESDIAIVEFFKTHNKKVFKQWSIVSKSTWFASTIHCRLGYLSVRRLNKRGIPILMNYTFTAR